MLRPLLAAVALGAALSVSRPALASSSVDELIRSARAHEAAGEGDIAARRYMEALSLDPTSENAYLGLGALRVKLGDLREAERVYSVALAHVPRFKKALEARARTRRMLGKNDDAVQDLEAYALLENDLDATKQLAGWYGEDGRAPAQLAAWRRVLVIATRGADEPRMKEARRMVRALQLLVGPADPVTSPIDPDPTRRAIAAIARRGG
jgi:tetratricopeptide (TPR) repeat protein